MPSEDHTAKANQPHGQRVIRLARLILLACTFLMALGNAVISVLYFHGSYWAEEYGLRWSIACVGGVVVCVPFVWKRNKSVAITAVVLSMPMMWLWGRIIAAIAAFAGDT